MSTKIVPVDLQFPTLCIGSVIHPTPGRKRCIWRSFQHPASSLAKVIPMLRSAVMLKAHKDHSLWFERSLDWIFGNRKMELRMLCVQLVSHHWSFHFSLLFIHTTSYSVSKGLREFAPGSWRSLLLWLEVWKAQPSQILGHIWDVWTFQIYVGNLDTRGRTKIYLIMSPACYALFDRTLRDGKRRGCNFFQRLLGDYVSGERTWKRPMK